MRQWRPPVGPSKRPRGRTSPPISAAGCCCRSPTPLLGQGFGVGLDHVHLPRLGARAVHPHLVLQGDFTDTFAGIAPVSVPASSRPAGRGRARRPAADRALPAYPARATRPHHGAGRRPRTAGRRLPDPPDRRSRARALGRIGASRPGEPGRHAGHGRGRHRHRRRDPQGAHRRRRRGRRRGHHHGLRRRLPGLPR